MDVLMHSRVVTSGRFRGGDGGDASPPTSLKVTILAEKSASVSNNSAPFRDASPPTDLNVTNPAKNQSQFWWRPFFFFFFFGDHLNLGEKNVWIFDFGRKITLNFGEDIRIFEVLCFKSPPPKFSVSATGCNIAVWGRVCSGLFSIATEWAMRFTLHCFNLRMKDKFIINDNF